MSAQDQIDQLAQYIMDSVPGEPSQNEGAGETAVRLLKKYQALLDAVTDALIALRCGGTTDGAHHKQWAIDQAVQHLLGSEGYDQFVLRLLREDASWDHGSAP